VALLHPSAHSRRAALKNFFVELKRRKVYRVAVAYVVVAWVLIQVATQVFPFFEIPNWVVRLVIIALVLGFPIAGEATHAFTKAKDAVMADAVRSPDDPKLLMMLGLIETMLGRAKEAIAVGERAVQLLPISADALDGPLLATNLAVIYAQQARLIAPWPSWNDSLGYRVDRRPALCGSSRSGMGCGVIRGSNYCSLSDSLRGNLDRFRMILCQ
jgi:hypothetical protein